MTKSSNGRMSGMFEMREFARWAFKNIEVLVLSIEATQLRRPSTVAAAAVS